MADTCNSCGGVMQGGYWTNGDGYDDAKYVNIAVPEMAGYCWPCVDDKKHPNFDKEIDAAFQAAGMCGFLGAYIGRCREQKPCTEHRTQLCWKCKQPATRHCNHTSFLVCGVPECAEHSHVHNTH